MSLIKRHFKRSGKSLLIVAVFLAGIIIIGSCAPGTPVPRGWSGTAVSNSSLFLGSRDGSLVAIDSTTGARAWAVSLAAGQPQPSGGFGCAAPGSAFAIYGTPAVKGDMIYVGAYVQQGNVSQGKIYAFTNGRDEPRWVYPRESFLGGPVVGSLVLSQDKVYFGVADGKVYALDAADGFKVAEFQTGGKVWSTLTIDGNTLYVGSFDKKLYALDAATLTPVKWKEFATDGAIEARPVVYKGTIYVGSNDRNLYAIDANTGSLKWKFPAGNWFWAEPVIYNDIIYAPNLDHKLYILNAATGAEAAPALDLGGLISSSPVQISGSIVVATESGKIYSVDTNGNKLRQIADLKEIINAPLASGDGVIYVHTDKDSLYAVDLNSGAVRQFLFK